MYKGDLMGEKRVETRVPILWCEGGRGGGPEMKCKKNPIGNTFSIGEKYFL